jgi:Domain of unknown function (DUF6930)
MANRKMRAPASVEWVGGCCSMPAYVNGEGKPYRPEMLIWATTDGLILGTEVAKPGELIGRAAEHLRKTIERPLAGSPQVPSRLRVASSDLAAALRTALPAGVDLVCAATPELDELMGHLREHLGDGGAEPTFLGGDVSPEIAAAFFAAAAALYRAKPWKVVPGDAAITVDIGELDVHEAVVTVIGQMGKSFGFVAFPSQSDYEAYLDAALAMEDGEEPSVPGHFGLEFVRGAEVPAAIRREIARHGWEVAGRSAYPELSLVDPDLIARPPVTRDLALAAAISLALVDGRAHRSSHPRRNKRRRQ